MEMKAAETKETKETNDDKLAKIVIKGMQSILSKIPDAQDKSNALGFLMMFAYEGMRETLGDEFVEGWLEGALESLQTTQPSMLIIPPAKH